MKDNNFLSLSTKFHFIPEKCCAKIIGKKEKKRGWVLFQDQIGLLGIFIDGINGITKQ